MGLSSATLFHFTGFEGLKGILNTRGFFPTCCAEEMPVMAAGLALAVPMVSFCDIRLTQVHEHTKKYGRCAIGLSKDWGITAGLNPVLYLTHGSRVFQSVALAIGVGMNQRTKDKKSLVLHEPTALMLENQLRLLAFVKPERGSRWNKEDQTFDPTSPTVYYDEREWRFVPTWDRPMDGAIPLDYDFMLPGTTLRTLKFAISANERFRTRPLGFAHGDVRHVLVENEDQANELLASSAWKGVFDSETHFARHIRLFSDLEEDY